jgi:transposase
VGGSLYYGEVLAIVCQYFSSSEGFLGILIVLLIVGEHLDCGLVLNADVNSGVWIGRRGGDKIEAFMYSM